VDNTLSVVNTQTTAGSVAITSQATPVGKGKMRNMGKFSTGRNKMAKCRCCRKLTHSSIDGCRGIEMCRVCLESSGEFNAHSDGHHEGGCPANCPTAKGVECVHEIRTRAQGLKALGGFSPTLPALFADQSDEQITKTLKILEGGVR
jgi:hypothetical protein